MPCYRPIPASRSFDGAVSLHAHSYAARQADGHYLELACGVCGACRARRVRDWAIRSTHETQTHKQNSFITLTYNPESLPADGSLDVEHWKKFRKRLRHHRGPFRFLHCGEYGERNRRPHYHALLFGIDFPDKQLLYENNGKQCFISAELEEIWGQGFCTIGPANYATASYVAGYVYKKLKDDLDDPRVYDDRGFVVPGEYAFDVKPEYVTMSRNKGLGTAFIERYWSDVYPRDEVRLGPKTFRPPKFYDKWLKENRPEVFFEVMQKREEYIGAQGATSEHQLKARRVIHEQKHATRSERFL